MPSFGYTPRFQEIQGLLKSDPDLFFTLLEDRERQLESYVDYAETTYTPELSSSGTPPTIGDTGYEFGAFSVQGRMCDVTIEVLFNGAGVSAGTGYYLILLPLRPKLYVQAGNNVNRRIGSFTFADASATSYEGAAFVNSGISATQFFVNLHGVAGFNWAAGSPANVAAGDGARATLRYMIDEQT